jgi:hypothetical protein
MTTQLDKVIFESRLTVGDLADHINYMYADDEIKPVAISNDLLMILETRLSEAVMREIDGFIDDYLS